MKTLRIAAAGIVAVLALTACKKILNSGDDSFHTRLVNLIEDSPTVQYKIDATVASSAGYQVFTSLAAARPGSHSVSFQAIRPQSLVTTDTTDPIDVSGSFDRKRAENFFSFEVRAGERLAFDVDSMKLGYLDDPVLVIYTASGEFVASADDRLQQNGSEPPNLDPYLVYKFEKAGRYIAMIRDSAERGNPNYVYRLAIFPIVPDFDVKGLAPAVLRHRINVAPELELEGVTADQAVAQALERVEVPR